MLDLTKPLVSKIRLDGTIQHVEYEGLPTICYCCGRYGHTEDSCPLRARQTQQPQSPVTLVVGLSQGETVGNADVTAVEREEQAFGDWMKVKPRNGRSIRTAKRDEKEPAQYNGKGGNRFNPQSSLDIAAEQVNGNPRTNAVEQKGHVSKQEAITRIKKAYPKAKSMDTIAIMSASTVDHGKMTKTPDTPSSIFVSPAFKESSQTTSLGPDHLAVILSPLTDEGPSTNAGDTLQPPKPTVSARIRKIGYPLKPPDKTHKSLHLAPRGKFKVSKLKTKDALGVPSEHLNHALSEALNRPFDSDDDLSFAEANEVEFDDDSLSDREPHSDLVL